MNSHARQFARGIDTSAHSMDNLERESRQAENATHSVFSGANAARFESSIGRINRGFRLMRNALAAIGIGAAIRETTQYGDRLFTANALTAGITRNVDSLGEAQRRAMDLSNKTGESYLQSYEGLTKMLTVTDGNVEKASQLTKIGAALAALNPAEGFEGALFALKELEGADTMSLRERFNIRVPTQEEAKKIAARDGRTVQQVMFDSLQQYLDSNFGGGKDGAGVEYLLNIKANTIGGQMNRIANSFRNIFTPMLVPFLDKTQKFLTGIGDWLQANQGEISSFFQGIATSAGPVFDFVKTLAGQLVERFKAIWPVIKPLGESLFRLFAAIGPPILKIGETIWSIVQPAFMAVGRGLTWVINLVSGWIERNSSMINGIIEGAGMFIKVVLGVATGVVNAVVWIGQGIWSVVEQIGQAAAWAWKNNPFTWMMDLIDRVFPGFKSALNGLWDWVKGLFSDFISWIWDNVFKRVGNWLSSIWEALGQGPLNFTFDVGGGGQQSVSPTDRGRDINEQDGSQTANESFFQRMGLKPLGVGAPAGSGSKNIGLNDKLNSISGGGREGVKNINITIQKQIENLIFQETKGLQDITSAVRRAVEQVMLDAVNEVNYSN